MPLKPAYILLGFLSSLLIVLAVAGLQLNYYGGLIGKLFELHSTIGNHFDRPADVYYTIIIFSVWVLGILFYVSKAYPNIHSLPPIECKALYGMVVISSFFFASYHYHWVQFPEVLFEEDGVFETMTFLVLLTSCAAFLFAAKLHPAPFKSAVPLALSFMAFAIFLGAMEEISWGQRIMAWDTPELVKKYNFKDETNIHNFFVGYNQFFRLLIALFLSSILLLSDKKKISLLRQEFVLLIPDHKYFYLPVFIIFSHVSDELFEVITSLFFLYYSIGIAKVCGRLKMRPNSGDIISISRETG